MLEYLNPEKKTTMLLSIPFFFTLSSREKYRHTIATDFFGWPSLMTPQSEYNEHKWSNVFVEVFLVQETFGKILKEQHHWCPRISSKAHNKLH